ncbi:MAG: thioredoxin [Gammaproteobacteria bacterium]
MSEHPHLYAVTTDDFEARVIAESRERPVLVDFWAAWCGPCRSIAPLLEQLVVQFAGRLAVAKVDTDAEQALAARFGIRSLPTLVLFKHGEPVEQIVGAQPLGAFVALVERHLDRDSDRRCQEAATLLAGGDAASARALLLDAWRADPDNTRVHPRLAAVLIDGGELDLAAEVLDAVPTRAIDDAVKHQQARLRFARLAEGSPSVDELRAAIAASEPPTERRFQWGVRQALDGDHAGALATLLDIVRHDRHYGDDAARRAMLDLFTLMPGDDPLIREYRTQLARALN